MGVEMSGVYIQAGGHNILKDVNLNIDPGEHIAIVGLSGAGKSSLVGLLLGWHRPSQGAIKVDGEILDGTLVQRLRQETAWIDPAVQLWNRSLYDNLRYGIEIADGSQMGATIQSADLYGVMERLPDGLKTSLGEGGGLVSGGEGQRVRWGAPCCAPGRAWRSWMSLSAAWIARPGASCCANPASNGRTSPCCASRTM